MRRRRHPASIVAMFERRMIVCGAFLLAGSISSAITVRAQVLHPIEPMPEYEVTTVKPWHGEGPDTPLRDYIQIAFGIPSSAVGRVFGPDWVSKTKYEIEGKPPKSIQDSMQTMTQVERAKQMRWMMQSLLADRFKLKVHFETREMPVYELVIAKGGSKLKDNPDSTKGQFVAGRKRQMSELKGTALPIRIFITWLMGDEEIDGRTVIDMTGLTGNYDILLDWAPFSGSAPSEGSSLFTALEEQLGLKLVPAKGAVEVVIIDHIESPSDN
jgi:bla regulator protein BlaR1